MDEAEASGALSTCLRVMSGVQQRFFEQGAALPGAAGKQALRRQAGSCCGVHLACLVLTPNAAALCLSTTRPLQPTPPPPTCGRCWLRSGPPSWAAARCCSAA